MQEWSLIASSPLKGSLFSCGIVVFKTIYIQCVSVSSPAAKIRTPSIAYYYRTYLEPSRKVSEHCGAEGNQAAVAETGRKLSLPLQY